MSNNANIIFAGVVALAGGLVMVAPAFAGCSKTSNTPNNVIDPSSGYGIIMDFNCDVHGKVDERWHANIKTGWLANRQSFDVPRVTSASSGAKVNMGGHPHRLDVDVSVRRPGDYQVSIEQCSNNHQACAQIELNTHFHSDSE